MSSKKSIEFLYRGPNMTLARVGERIVKLVYMDVDGKKRVQVSDWREPA